MPRSNKTRQTHATNVLIACVTQLTISFRTFLEASGITEGPAIDQLHQMELVLPTLLNLSNESIADTEIEALMGKTQRPINDNPPPVSPAHGPVAGVNFPYDAEG